LACLSSSSSSCPSSAFSLRAFFSKVICTASRTEGFEQALGVRLR
jgi:hypothetical protein